MAEMMIHTTVYRMRFMWIQLFSYPCLTASTIEYDLFSAIFIKNAFTNLTFFYHRDIAIGDTVTVGECRPLSKTVRFNVLRVAKAAGAKKQFKKF